MNNDETIVKVELLKNFCTTVLRKIGVPSDEAVITSDILVSADLRGTSSHGVQRLPRYAKRLMNGWMRTKAKLTIRTETPLSLLIDAENSLGQVACYKSMNLCIKKAKKNFFGFAAVTNSNHIGIAGYYAMMALKENMIGLCMTNAWPLVVPTFGAEPRLGTNPIAIAVPTKNEPPYVLDMATSVVPIGKMEVFRRLGKKVPSGWAIDEKGNPALDTDTIMRCVYKSKRGGLLPLGGLEETAGYKGYGLALLVDIMAGILPGAAYGTHIGNPEEPVPSNIGHFLAAINVNAFTSLEEFTERMDTMIKEIKNSMKEKGSDRIYIHGEKEWEFEKKHQKLGVPIYKNVLSNLEDLANTLELEFPIG